MIDGIVVVAAGVVGVVVQLNGTWPRKKAAKGLSGEILLSLALSGPVKIPVPCQVNGPASRGKAYFHCFTILSPPPEAKAIPLHTFPLLNQDTFGSKTSKVTHRAVLV